MVSVFSTKVTASEFFNDLRMSLVAEVIAKRKRGVFDQQRDSTDRVLKYLS